MIQNAKFCFTIHILGAVKSPTNNLSLDYIKFSHPSGNRASFSELLWFRSSGNFLVKLITKPPELKWRSFEGGRCLRSSSSSTE